MGNKPGYFNKKEVEDKDMEEYDNKIFSGEGIRKMKAYKCNLKIDELYKIREKFWKKKTNPKTANWTIWKIIEKAVKYDECRALLLLEEYGLQIVSGCINKIIDKNGNIYKIPNYCINEPYYEKKTITNDKAKKENFKIKFYTYGKKETFMEINNQLTGKELKKQYKNKNKIDNNKEIRLFISGVEIKNDQYLFQYNIDQEKPILVIIN